MHKLNLSKEELEVVKQALAAAKYPFTLIETAVELKKKLDKLDKEDK